MSKSFTSSLDKFMVETYNLLMKYWKDVALAVSETCTELCGTCEVYIIGSVARGTATCLSDLDVLVVVPETCNARETKKALLRKVIWKIPYDYPLNLHVVKKGEEERYLRKGFVRVK